ncbi:MAG: O-antigen ligase family protein [Thermodesulfobacteriota bacterium]
MIKDDRGFEFLKQSVPILMGIFLFFNPFPHTTTIKEVSLYLSVIIVFLLIVFKKIDFSFKTPLSIPFALFVLWSFVGLFFALNKPNSIHDFYAHLLKYLVFYYIMVNFFDTRKRLTYLTWIIIISATIFSFGGMAYFYLMLGQNVTKRFVFIPYLDFLYVFAIILSLRYLFGYVKPYGKAIALICLAGTSMATLLTQTRNALLAIFISLVILLPKNKKGLIILIVSLIVVGFMPIKDRFTLDNILNNERLGINYVSFEIIKDHPIFGIGFGMQTYDNKDFLDKYNARVPVKYRREPPVAAPHNLLFDVAVRTGLAGLSFFFCIVVSFIRMSWKIIRYGKDDFIKNFGLYLVVAFIAFFIQSMFADATFGLQAIVFYTILGMMTILWRLDMELDNQPDIKSAYS